jgi:hypothetical protein
MRAARTESPSPQRALLTKIADTLAAQERAADRIAIAVHESAQSQDEIQLEDLLKELLDLPEPQALMVAFFREHGGSSDSEPAFASFAGNLLRAAAARVFEDLAGANQLELERLLLLAADGNVAAVAMAGLAAPAAPGPPSYWIPGVAGHDREAMGVIAGAMDQSVRRQLRLTTLLHGQAEAMLRVQQRQLHGWALLWGRIQQLARLPRLREAPFTASDLAELVLNFDAVGELVDTAAECVATGEPAQAVHLLSGLRLPTPAGLPGRLYHQESLAQVRPLAGAAIRHRLAVSRWAAAAMRSVGSMDGAR